MVTELIEEGKAKIQVLRSTDKWYGVTYREDKPLVVEAIARKTAEGQYRKICGPDHLDHLECLRVRSGHNQWNYYFILNSRKICGTCRGEAPPSC